MPRTPAPSRSSSAFSLPQLSYKTSFTSPSPTVANVNVVGSNPITRFPPEAPKHWPAKDNRVPLAFFVATRPPFRAPFKRCDVNAASPSLSPLGLRRTAVPCAGLLFGTELGTGTPQGVRVGTEKVTGWSAGFGHRFATLGRGREERDRTRAGTAKKRQGDWAARVPRTTATLPRVEH
jgi:hypothetical protein